jgi:hypothetical protein
MTKKKNIKGIKPEVIAVAAFFMLMCLYVLGITGRNIISALSSNKTNSSETENNIESVTPTIAEVQSQVAEPVLLTENPVKKVRAIVDDSALINDGNQWCKVGDMVGGQAKILAIEPNGIFVEWNSMQNFVPLEYSAELIPQSQTRQTGTQFNNLTEEQRARIQQGLQALSNLTEEQKTRIAQGLQGLQSLGQMWQNMTPQYQAQTRARLEELGQRIQNMPQEERQNSMQRLGQQWQQWLQTDQSQMPNFTLE